VASRCEILDLPLNGFCQLFLFHNVQMLVFQSM